MTLKLLASTWTKMANEQRRLISRIFSPQIIWHYLQLRQYLGLWSVLTWESTRANLTCLSVYYICLALEWETKKSVNRTQRQSVTGDLRFVTFIATLTFSRCLILFTELTSFGWILLPRSIKSAFGCMELSQKMGDRWIAALELACMLLQIEWQKRFKHVIF